MRTLFDWQSFDAMPLVGMVRLIGALESDALLRARDWTGPAQHIRRHVEPWCSLPRSSHP